MNLKEYIRIYHKGDVDRFAFDYEISRATIYNWISKKVRPTKVYARYIEKITDGLVTFTEMREKEL